MALLSKHVQMGVTNLTHGMPDKTWLNFLLGQLEQILAPST
jgi:hypothetical protein